jgi:hypothetical protein
MNTSIDSAQLESDVDQLRANARRSLENSYVGLIHLFDLPLERIQKVTTYPTKKALVNALMSGISASAEFAVKIGLLAGDDVKGLYEKYLALRPDVFAEA